MTVKQLFRQLQQEKYDEKNVPVVFVDSKGRQHGVASCLMDNGKLKLCETDAAEGQKTNVDDGTEY